MYWLTTTSNCINHYQHFIFRRYTPNVQLASQSVASFLVKRDRKKLGGQYTNDTRNPSALSAWQQLAAVSQTDETQKKTTTTDKPSSVWWRSPECAAVAAGRLYDSLPGRFCWATCTTSLHPSRTHPHELIIIIIVVVVIIDGCYDPPQIFRCLLVLFLLFFLYYIFPFQSRILYILYSY